MRVDSPVACWQRHVYSRGVWSLAPGSQSACMRGVVLIDRGRVAALSVTALGASLFRGVGGWVGRYCSDREGHRGPW